MGRPKHVLGWQDCMNPIIFLVVTCRSCSRKLIFYSFLCFWHFNPSFMNHPFFFFLVCYLNYLLLKVWISQSSRNWLISNPILGHQINPVDHQILWAAVVLNWIHIPTTNMDPQYWLPWIILQFIWGTSYPNSGLPDQCLENRILWVPICFELWTFCGSKVVVLVWYVMEQSENNRSVINLQWSCSIMKIFPFI